MTGIVPVMWAVWGGLVVIVLALKVYTGRLTKDEDDQLVLDSAFDRIKDEQAAHGGQGPEDRAFAEGRALAGGFGHGVL